MSHWKTRGIRETVRKLPTAFRQIRSDFRSFQLSSTEVQQIWQTRNGLYSPEYYALLGPNETSEVILDAVSDRFRPSEAPAILEVGCSSGRHLERLRREGYENLSGVEINPNAATVLEKAYPELEECVDLRIDAIEDVICTFDTDRFDIVFAVETFELVPPASEWVFAEVARITEDTLVSVSSAPDRWDDRRPAEGQGTYPFFYREYETVFQPHGFETIDRRAVPGSDLTLWIFDQPP